MNTLKFSFVIHPLNLADIHAHPSYRWTRHLPDPLVERAAAYMPPIFIGKIKGITSPTTGKVAEGYLYALSATPEQLLRHKPEFTYRRVIRAAKMAESHGAKIIGLGAFTSVVGDAGITIAKRAPIAVTSGNSLTAAIAIESARRGAEKMGINFPSSSIMVVGATGSIGSAVVRHLVHEVKDLILISRSPQKLDQLKHRVEHLAPEVHVEYATSTTPYLPKSDIIITATSAIAERIIDVSQCKPGAIICDVARPFDINEEEAILRPDILVVDSGEIKLPGDVEVGYNIGLEPGVVFACMAETILLTLESKFENYTLGRDISPIKLDNILRLYKKHQFQLAPLRSFGRIVNDNEIKMKRLFASSLTNDDLKRRRIMNTAKLQISRIPPMAKGIKKAS